MVKQEISREAHLGEELSDREAECYGIICSTSGFTPTKAIYKQMYGLRVKEGVEDAVGVLVRRIRDKLGKTEIITRKGLGYQSRRALITEIVASNSKAK